MYYFYTEGNIISIYLIFFCVFILRLKRFLMTLLLHTHTLSYIFIASSLTHATAFDIVYGIRKGSVQGRRRRRVSCTQKTAHIPRIMRSKRGQKSNLNVVRRRRRRSGDSWARSIPSWSAPQDTYVCACTVFAIHSKRVGQRMKQKKKTLQTLYIRFSAALSSYSVLVQLTIMCVPNFYIAFNFI